MVSRWIFGVMVCLVMAAGGFAQTQVGDVVLGLNNSNPSNTMELARGPAMANGGVNVTDVWDTAWINSVEFDNLNGVSHNASGNLLGVDFAHPARTAPSTIFRRQIRR